MITKETTVALIAGALLNPSYIHTFPAPLFAATLLYHNNMLHAFLPRLHLVLGGGGTSDNFNELTGNDGLTSAVEQNLELGDHVTGVLGSILTLFSKLYQYVKDRKTYVHSITTGRLFTGMSLSKGPEEGVGESIFTEVTKGLIFDLECGEVGCLNMSALSYTLIQI